MDYSATKQSELEDELIAKYLILEYFKANLIIQFVKNLKFYEEDDEELFFDISSHYDKSNFKIIDTHCHPHDDASNLRKIAKLKVIKVIIMGVSEEDWENVNKVQIGYARSNTEQPLHLQC
jgi:hypothetical protein